MPELRAVVYLLLSLAPVASGVVWGRSEIHLVLPSSVHEEIGSSYYAAVPRSRFAPIGEVLADTPSHPDQSTLRLFEGQRRLGPNHAQHESIRSEGAGRFSHWGGVLYFSTSDNSDPRNNGREYSFVTTARVPFVVAWAWAVCFVSGALKTSTRPRSGRDRGFWLWLLIAGAIYAATASGVAGTTRWTGVPVPAAVAASLSFAMAMAWKAGGAFAHAPWTIVHGSRGRAARWAQTLNESLERRGHLGRLLRVLSVLASFAVFALLPVVGWPRDVLLAAYDSTVPLALPAGAILYLAHRAPGKLGEVSSLGVTLSLFSLPLAALWQDAAIHYNAIGGLLPWSDAGGYYFDAQRLHDGHLLGWSARRPLFTGLLASLLTVTGGNLQVSLALLAALNGVATFLLAREVRAWSGPTEAAVVTLMGYLFYRVDGGAGTTLTENLGFAMGALAFAVIIRGSQIGGPRTLVMGVAYLTVALMARAGAFFVLPAIGCVAMYVWRNEYRWWQVGGAILAAILVTAFLVLGLGRLMTDPTSSQAAFSNFSYSLYGLVVGGKGWGQVLIDHPGATEGAEIYRLALEEFIRRPQGFVEGALATWRTYLSPNEAHHALAFVRDRDRSFAIQLIAASFVLAGCVQACIRRSKADLMVLAIAAGHLASIPFVPPADAGLRVYAATMPVLALLAGSGVGIVVRPVTRTARWLRGAPPVRNDRPAPVSPVGIPPQAVALALSAVLFAGPLLVYATADPVKTAAASCPPGEELLHVRLSPGAYLRVEGTEDTGSNARLRAVEVHEERLRREVEVVELRHDARLFVAGRTVLVTYDVNTGRRAWLVAATARTPRRPGVYPVCGRASQDELSKVYGVFVASRFGPQGAP